MKIPPIHSIARRRFIQKTAAVAAGATSPLVWAQGSDAPERTTVRLSFLPVSDCAVSVMAAVLDTGKRYGIKIELSKDAGPVPQRDRLLNGEVDAVGNGLHGMFEGIQIGAGGTKMEFAILMGASRNGQGITISNQMLEQGAKDGTAFAKMVQTDKREYRAAHTYPTGCHNLWLNYWLAANGINPLTQVKTMAIAAPQMVANMRVGNMDIFCCGEPWPARAIGEKVGYTASTSQMIWADHPEKVVVTTAEFANKYPKTAAALVAALLDAAKYVEADANRAKVAQIIAEKAYVNCPVSFVEPRLVGNYDDGNGKTWKDPLRAKFFDDGKVTQPLVSSSLWFLSQQKRWKMIDASPALILDTAKKIVRSDIYAAGAAKARVTVAKAQDTKVTLIDGVVWDPTKFETYADSFKIKA